MTTNEQITALQEQLEAKEGEEAANAFLGEVGRDRYLEYCKLISL